MRKLFLFLLVPFLMLSLRAMTHNPGYSPLNWIGWNTGRSKPGALLTSNGTGTFDIQINTVESSYTFNLLIDDKPLQSAILMYYL